MHEGELFRFNCSPALAEPCLPEVFLDNIVLALDKVAQSALACVSDGVEVLLGPQDQAIADESWCGERHFTEVVGMK